MLPAGLRANERERSIRQLVREWEATFAALHDGAMVLDGSARVVRVNPAFRRMLAVTPGTSLAGIGFEDLLGRHAGGSGREAAEMALRTLQRPVAFIRGNRSLELTVSAVEEAEVAVGFVAIVTDVTAARRLERQRLRLKERTLEAQTARAEAERLGALERMKTNLLNLISHELRTPVTVMAGYVDLLNEGDLGPLPPHLTAVLPLLQEQVVRITELIADVLDVARLEERRLHLEVRAVDLDQAVTDAARAVSGGYAGCRLRLVGAGGPVAVAADGDRVRASVMALIDNALKFSSAEVEVRVWSDEAAGYVTVVDRGTDIPSAEHEAIFSRFGRRITPENAHLPGTGLRLHVAREVARLHGGDLTVESEAEGGNRFTLRLPRALPAAGSD